MGDISNVRIEPMVFYWGEDLAQIETISCVADVSSSLNDKYFIIYSAKQETTYYCWFNVDAAGADPSITGMSPIEIAISENASANTVAVALQTALDLEADFGATVSAEVVTVTLVGNGLTYPSHEVEALNTVGFSHAVTKYGFESYEIGCIDGDIEFTAESDLVDVLCHQQGTNILGQIVTGKQMELTVNFKETNKEGLDKLWIKTQNDYIMSNETNSTAAVGLGSRRNFANLFDIAMPVRLHPKRLVEADKSEDYFFFKAMPRVESATFSGENIRTVPTMYKLYLDESEGRDRSFGIFGDFSKFVS